MGPHAEIAGNVSGSKVNRNHATISPNSGLVLAHHDKFTR